MELGVRDSAWSVLFTRVTHDQCHSLLQIYVRHSDMSSVNLDVSLSSARDTHICNTPTVQLSMSVRCCLFPLLHWRLCLES